MSNKGNTFRKATTFVNLLSWLRDPLTGKGPNLRIGGDSADLSWWWNVTNARDNQDKTCRCCASYNAKRCVSNNLTTSLIRTLQEDIAIPLNSTLVFDVSMLQNASANWAVQEIIGIFQALSSSSSEPAFPKVLEGIEIGNEADMYDRGLRSPNYTVEDYLRELDMYMRTIFQNPTIQNWLQQHRPGEHPFQIVRAGGFAYKWEFLNRTADMLQHYKQFLYSWSDHHYPTLACNISGRPDPTIADLLSEASSHAYATHIAPRVAFVTQPDTFNPDGVAFHLGETNSAACSGMLGVSNTMASALWALDYMFELAQVGVSRVNFHGGDHAPYSWWWIDVETGVPKVQPLYYAMYVWSQYITNQGPGTRIIPFPLSPSAQPGNCHSLKDGDPKGGCIKTWAVKDDNLNIRVVIINKLLNPTQKQQKVKVTLSSCYQGGYVGFLGPTASANHKGLSSESIDFSGLTWEGSQHGERMGQYVPIPVLPVKAENGTCHYTVDVFHATATIVSFQAKQLPPDFNIRAANQEIL